MGEPTNRKPMNRLIACLVNKSVNISNEGTSHLLLNCVLVPKYEAPKSRTCLFLGPDTAIAE